MAPIKVAFYGCGGIARYHLANLREVPEVAIVGGFDLSADAMRSFRAGLSPADDPKFQAVDSPEALFALKPDAVYVCTPPFARGEFEVAAAKKKIHLFLEKPIALSMEIANRIAAAVRENGVMMSSGYSLRYNAVYRQLAQAVRARKVSLALVTRWNKLVPVPWWKDRAKSGGQLTEMTTHQVDLLLWMLGDALDVYGLEHSGLLGTEVTIPDAQAGLVRFSSGAIASITTSCGLKGNGGYNDMEFICEDTRISLVGGELKSDPEVKLAEATAVPSIDACFIQAIRTKNATPIESTLDRALKALELTLKISDFGAAVNRRMEIGMMSACVAGNDWETRFKATRDLGLDFIEAALSQEEAEKLASGKGGALIEELVGLSKKFALPVRSVVWPLYKDFDLAWAKDKKACVNGLKPALELLKRCGGDVVLFPHRFGERRPFQDEAVVEGLRAWADLAAQDNILLCVEQIPSSKYQPSSEEVAALVRQVDRKNVRVYYDIANPLYRGEDVMQAARNLTPLAGQVHMKGFKDQQPLTQMPVKEVRQLLVAAGFQGRVALEDDAKAATDIVKADVKVLREAGF